MSAPSDGIPLPHPTALSRPHWEGCREGVLRVQRCRDCGTYVFIPQPCCTSCLGEDLEWVESSGRGTLYSYTVVHRPQQPSFEVPYTVVIVELEEGWHMLSNLVDCQADEIEIGMPLEVVYHEMSDEITLPLFRRRS
ncbi:MAG: Zn-ribbon domain-containing OB-fold protein [Deltaproteobacteria bacterium]|nr:Zn-ribbon domain-containing OB-fold protein [Deltaproteobacteria bacterium]MBW2500331.1 Zn-ribbon domain-containing OB-fold protein [Deltaproteobacteria bacterium]